MQNKEIEKLLSCDNCPFHTCEGCEITWTDRKKIKEYIDQQENKVKELGKGQHTLMQSRRKWKNRYYKERRKRKEADKAEGKYKNDYQDIGKMYFYLDEKRQNIIQQLKTKYEQLTQSVKRYEEMRRNCRLDSFYKKSYQTTIHRLNAKRETISNIIDLLEK